MTIFWARVFSYTFLPLLIATALIRLDSRIVGRRRRIETYLIYLFALGVAGSGIGSFVGHLFLSDQVAASIGWPAGSPFQLEMGFANLALGVLGLIAVGRRDGFREATVIAVTVLGVGATVVHVWDIVLTGNLAPGNTVQNISNLLRPALLIGLLAASRRADRSVPAGSGPDAGFDTWRMGHAQAAGWMTALVATGMAVGYALDRTLAGVLLGVIAGSLALWLTLREPRQSRR